jgi:hypothetical protein
MSGEYEANMVKLTFTAEVEVPPKVAQRILADPELKRVTFVQYVRFGQEDRWSYDLRPFGEWRLS